MLPKYGHLHHSMDTGDDYSDMVFNGCGSMQLFMLLVPGRVASTLSHSLRHLLAKSTSQSSLLKLLSILLFYSFSTPKVFPTKPQAKNCQDSVFT